MRRILRKIAANELDSLGDTSTLAEPQVVEVYGDTGETSAAAWAHANAAGFSTRVEVTGETAFCYLSEARPLLRHLAGQGGLRYLHRPANLEDVFLKLTGRDLRD